LGVLSWQQRRHGRPGHQGSLKKRGIRLTRQRRLLLDLIEKSGQHLDAEQLYEQAKQKDPKAQPRDGVPHAEDA